MDERTPLVKPPGRPVDDPERLSEAKGETRPGVDMVFFLIAVLGTVSPVFFRKYPNGKPNMTSTRCLSRYWR